MFYGDIAEYIVENFADYKDANVGDIKKRISGILSRDIKKSSSTFSKVANGKKVKGKISYKKGFYALRPEKKEKPIIIPDKPRENKSKSDGQLSLFNSTSKAVAQSSSIDPFMGINTTYQGKGGEYAVASELLFRGFNTNMMTVDDGIDIIASKDQKFYFIQVKTRAWNNDSLSVQFDVNSYSRYSNSVVFYIIVIRYQENHKYVNQYIVLPTSIIDKCIYDGTIGFGNKYYYITIKQQGKELFICGKENRTENISAFINNFNCIK